MSKTDVLFVSEGLKLTLVREKSKIMMMIMMMMMKMMMMIIIIIGIIRTKW